MTNKKPEQEPEALRLARLLALDKWPDAAAELRRQHDRIAELDALLSACINLLKKAPKITHSLYVGKDSQAWGVQAQEVLDAAIVVQAKNGGV